MKYAIDNDLHIHSRLSLCSMDEEQTPENILLYAKRNGLKTICLTDHFWDDAVEGASEWYSGQNYQHISAFKALPKMDGVRFLFGCETELDKFLTLGISKKKMDLFDFIIIPTTHFHMIDYTITQEQAQSPKTRAETWIKRFDAVLDMDLPFYKIGIAHLTCHLLAPTREEYLDVLNSIPTDKLQTLFVKAEKLGVGIELNVTFSDDEADTVLRPYRIAKECGCKFYLGSDAHHPCDLLNAMNKFQRVVDMLELEESDKFFIKL